MAIKKGAALFVAATIAVCHSTGSAVAYRVTHYTSACSDARGVEADDVTKDDSDPRPTMRHEAELMCPMGYVRVGAESVQKGGAIKKGTAVIIWAIKCKDEVAQNSPPLSCGRSN